MTKWIVTNSEHNKGIIVEANSFDEARKKANYLFYSPFPSKKDLNTGQIYEKGKHTFVRASGNKIFGFFQFHSMGGVTTSYDVNIDTEPTSEQINFLDRPIEYIKFFETEKNRY
jgi:hypothetical protein